MAINFSSANNTYVNLGACSPLEILGDVTLCGWIYPRTLGANNLGYIYARYDSNISNSGLQLNLGSIGYGFRTGSTYCSTSTSPLIMNQWNFIACLKSGTSGADYFGSMFCSSPQFNFNPVATATMSSTIATTTPQGIIGNNSTSGPTRAFDGYISDFRIYNRALEVAELQSIFWSQGFDGIINGLKARWQMIGSETSIVNGTNAVIDCSGNACHGTAGNSPTWQPAPIRIYK